MNIIARPNTSLRNLNATSSQTRPTAPDRTMQPVIIELKGPLCLNTRRGLESVINLGLSQAHKRFVIDLEQVTSIDSSGLSALVNCLNAARQAGSEVRFCGANSQLKALLQRTGLSRVLRVYDNFAAAVQTMSAGAQEPALNVAV